MRQETPRSSRRKMCAACGRQCAGETSFCPSCGKPLPSRVGERPSAKRSSRHSTLSRTAERGDSRSFRSASRKRRSRKKRLVAIAVPLALLAAIGGFYAWSQRPIPITSEAFPDERLLSAVQAQLDDDGDGFLSVEERRAVSGLGYLPDSIMFFKDGDSSILAEPLITSFSGGESADPDIDPSDADPLQGTGLFSGITSMVLADPALHHVDLSAYPSLEYFNSIASGIEELDVSSSKNLERLFCASNVVLKGIEASDLFCTELLTRAFFHPDKEGRKAANVIYSVKYDAFGRPLEVWSTAGVSKTFAYDEAGRCISTESNRHERSQTYEYGASGLLEKRVATYSLAADSPDTTIEEYVYDSEGRMIQLTRSENGSTSTTHYDHEGGSLVASSTVGFRLETAGYAFSDEGDIEAVDIKSASALESVRYSYDDSGFLTGKCERQDANDSTRDLYYATSYSPRGVPVCSFKDMKRVDYRCDDGDYVEAASLDESMSGDMFPAGLMIQAEYVEMVAPLSARPMLRYVPSFSFGVVDEFDALGRQWGQGSGGDLGATIIEYGPERAYGRAMGIDPPLLTNANEASLLQYDRDRWLDGVARDALLSAETIPGAVDAEVDRPNAGIGVDGYVVTSSYRLDLPSEWLSASSVIAWPNDTVQVFYQGNPRWELLSASICDANEPRSLGDYSNALLAYVELGGKRVNLRAPVWTMMATEAIRYEGHQDMDEFSLLAGATEQQMDELMHFATGLDPTCAVIAESPDIQEANNDLFAATEAFYEQKIASTVRLV